MFILPIGILVFYGLWRVFQPVPSGEEKVNVILWAVLASFCATGMETAYRSSARSWLALLPFTFIPIVLINFCIFKLMRSSSSLLSALILFALTNLGMRVVATMFLLKEPIGKGTWAALGLLVAAQVVKSVWR